MSMYLCPACGATKKNCKVCKGKGKVPLSIIHKMGKRPKRNIRSLDLRLRE